MTRCKACDHPLRGTPFCPGCGKPTRALGATLPASSPVDTPPAPRGVETGEHSTMVIPPTPAAESPLPPASVPPPVPERRPEPTRQRRAPVAEAQGRDGTGKWIVVTGLVALGVILFGCCLMWGTSVDAPPDRAARIEESPQTVQVLPPPPNAGRRAARGGRGDAPSPEPTQEPAAPK